MNWCKALMFTSAVVAIHGPALAQDSRAPHRSQERSDRRAPDWRLYVTSGAGYTRRDGDEEASTDYYRIPLSARLTKGRFRLSASMPYLIVNGPATVTGDDDDVGGDPAAGERETRKGFGDLSITGRYRIPDDVLGGVDLDLMGRVKLPTASRRTGLGTGEADFAVGAELSRDIGRLEPFLSGQYRINGDPPARTYRNTVATSLGTGIRLGRRTSASLAWDYSQSRIRGRSGSHMLDTGLSTRLNRRLSLGAEAAVGLSKNAPDFRVGATVTARVF